MKQYVEKHFYNWFFSSLIVLGLSRNLFAGFDMRNSLSENASTVLGLASLMMAVLFLARFNKFGKRIAGITTTAILLGLAVILFRAGAFWGTETIDVSPSLFWVVLVGVSMAVFWLGRSRGGILILFLAGGFIAAAFALFKYPVSLWAYLLFFFGTIALFFYHISNVVVLENDENHGIFKVHLIQPLIASLILCLLAGGTYYSIIKPFSKPVDEGPLAEKLLSIELLNDLGMSSNKVVLGDRPEELDDASQTQPEEIIKETKQEKEDSEEKKQESGKLGEGINLIKVLAVTYENHGKAVWIFISATLFFLVAAILLKRFLRRKWYSELLKKSNEAYVLELYSYFLKALRKAGLKRSEEVTLTEYVSKTREKFERFSVYNATFLKLTQSYMKILYGFQEISDEEKELFHDFYNEFHKNLRMEIGRRNYCLQYFRI